MCKYSSTSVLVERLSYHSSASDFFSNFSSAWAGVKNYVYKLETRQVYREPGNPSYDALESGNFDEAIKLIEKVRQEDVGLYKSLEEKGVDFIRCRPVVLPLSDYLKWEMECYKFNALHGENIFFSDFNDLYEKYALHDFMIFDSDIAFIHDYDACGEIKGGWSTNDKKVIDQLKDMFVDIKNLSRKMSV